MIVVLVLIIPIVVLRALGWAGVKALASWKDCGRYGLAMMFLFTGAAHFTELKHEMAAMIPPQLPNGLWVIYLTGVLEIAGAIGLLIPRLQRIAGFCLILLLVAMFPANMYAALKQIPIAGHPAIPIIPRTLMQLFFIGVIWWSAVREAPKNP